MHPTLDALNVFRVIVNPASQDLGDHRHSWPNFNQTAFWKWVTDRLHYAVKHDFAPHSRASHGGFWSPPVRANQVREGSGRHECSRAQLQLETGHQTHMESVPPHPTSLKVSSKENPSTPGPLSPSPRHLREACAGKKRGSGPSKNRLQGLG